MKRHEFYFTPLPASPLLGIKFCQYDIQDEDTESWYPCKRLEIGFIFFTISYTNISLD